MKKISEAGRVLITGSAASFGNFQFKLAEKSLAETENTRFKSQKLDSGSTYCCFQAPIKDGCSFSTSTVKKKEKTRA